MKTCKANKKAIPGQAHNKYTVPRYSASEVQADREYERSKKAEKAHQQEAAKKKAAGLEKKARQKLAVTHQEINYPPNKLNIPHQHRPSPEETKLYDLGTQDVEQPENNNHAGDNESDSTIDGYESNQADSDYQHKDTKSEESKLDIAMPEQEKGKGKKIWKGVDVRQQIHRMVAGDTSPNTQDLNNDVN